MKDQSAVGVEVIPPSETTPLSVSSNDTQSIGQKSNEAKKLKFQQFIGFPEHNIIGNQSGFKNSQNSSE